MIALVVAALVTPIAGGTIDTTDVAVGQLVGSAGTLCTATLIGPSLAVTAAHCTDDATLVLALEDGDHAVASVMRAPLFDATTLASDIALLSLATPSAVTSLALADAAAGQAVLLVGFGRDDVGGSGTRRAAPTTIDALGGARFTTRVEGTACAGDSGGAVLVDTPQGRALAGVISTGQATCGAASSHMRVAAFVPWIAPGTVSDTAPTVSLLPAEGDAVPDVFTATLTVGDDHGALRATLYVDGALVGQREVTGTTLAFELAIGPGEHVLAADVVDASGLVGHAEADVLVEPPLSPTAEAGGCSATRSSSWLMLLVVAGLTAARSRRRCSGVPPTWRSSAG